MLLLTRRAEQKKMRVGGLVCLAFSAKPPNLSFLNSLFTFLSKQFSWCTPSNWMLDENHYQNAKNVLNVEPSVNQHQHLADWSLEWSLAVIHPTP